MIATNRPFLQSAIIVIILAALTAIAYVAVGKYCVFVPIAGIPLWLALRGARRRVTLAAQGWRGRRYDNYWVYEEQQGKDRPSLSIKLRFEKPDRYILVVPSASEWRRTMPLWAAERRAEIMARVTESWAPEDVEWPPGEFAGGRRR